MWIKKQFKTTLGKVGFLSEVVPLLRAIIGCIRFVLEMAGDKEEAEKLMQGLPQFVTAPWFSIVFLCFGLVLIWWNSQRSVRKKLSATEIKRKQEMGKQLDGLEAAEMEVVNFLRIHGTALPSQIVTYLRGKGFEQANGVLDNLRAKTTLVSTIDGMSGSVGINPAMKELLEEITTEIGADSEDENPAANRRSWVLAIVGVSVLIAAVIGSNLLWRHLSTKAVTPKQQQTGTTPNSSAQSTTAPTTPATTGTARTKTNKSKPKKQSRKIATPQVQAASEPNTGDASPTSGPPTSGLKIINNFLAGPKPIRTGNSKDTTIIDNDYYQSAPDLSNAQRTLMENNRMTGTPSTNITLGGEDTTFRNNTVAGDNFTVTDTAKRTLIHDNLFQSQVLISSISSDQKNVREREAWLQQLRTAFESRWQTLPPAKYQANEQLLKQFENSVRDAAYDEKASRVLLEKMIDATPKELSH